MSELDFIGIDVAKDKLDVVLLKNDKSYKKQVDNKQTGFVKLLTWINKQSKNPFVCLEATGIYSEGVAEYLARKKIQVSVVNPLQIKHFAKLMLARNKNDSLDARLIALYAQKMSPALFKPRSKQQKQLRELVQLTSTLKEQKEQLKNQLSTAQSSEGKKYYKQVIKKLERQIASLQGKKKALMKADEKLKAKVDLLIEIKGMGVESALKILAYLPEIDHFGSAKALAAYIGLSPKQRESGKYKGKTCLSKQGNSKLRAAFYMPALSAKNHSEALAPFVNRLKAKGMAAKAIVGAVMRKLAHILYGMLKHGTAFNGALACAK